MFLKFSRFARLAYIAALFIVGLLAIFSGHFGGGAVLAAATLTRDDLGEILSQIFGVADGCGPSKDDMRQALDEISDLSDPDSELERDKSGNWSVVEGDEDDQDMDDEDAGDD